MGPKKMMKLNSFWYWSATFTIVSSLNSATVSSNQTSPIHVERLLITECKEKIGNMPKFKYQGKTYKNKNCDWLLIKTLTKREKLCTLVEIVKNHCPKTCNSCPTEIKSNHPSIIPSATHTCKDKMGNMSKFKDPKKNIIYKKKNCDWLIINKKREGLCDRVEIVKKHCPKTCNSCPIFSPTETSSIVPTNHPSIIPSATHTCKDKMGNMSKFKDPKTNKIYKKKNCDWL